MKKIILSALMVTALTSATVLVNSASADTFAKTRKAGGVFKAWYDSSVSMYGYTPHFDQGRANWGGITTNVSIGKSSSPDDSHSTDEYYVGESSVADLYGQSSSYVVSWPTNKWVDPDVSNWDYNVVSIYDNNIRSADYFNWNDITLIITHELGHTLGLAHTTGPDMIRSIMTDGDNNTMMNFTPTTYDQGELKKKWP